jgi:hypothetical protein
VFPAMDPLLMLVPSTRAGLSVSSPVPYHLSLFFGTAGRAHLVLNPTFLNDSTQISNPFPNFT